MVAIEKRRCARLARSIAAQNNAHSARCAGGEQALPARKTTPQERQK